MINIKCRIMKNFSISSGGITQFESVKYPGIIIRVSFSTPTTIIINREHVIFRWVPRHQLHKGGAVQPPTITR